MSLPQPREPNDLTAARKRTKARIDFRPTAEQKALFERAAALEGLSLTDFLIRSAEENSRRVLADHEAITLRDEASAAFVKLLLDPPAPTERLRAAFERHGRDVRTR